jgi:hypothetical protein
MQNDGLLNGINICIKEELGMRHSNIITIEGYQKK